MPQTAPTAHRKPVRNRFCLKLGLTFHSTAMPTPAAAQSPPNRLPKLMTPYRYSWVSSTLEMQLGTSPNSAATMG